METPKKIYLQVGEAFSELSTTWCSDRIDESDVEYVIASKEPNNAQTEEAKSIFELLDFSSKRLIGKVKKRYKELERKRWEWKGFYHGWLEGRFDLIGYIHKSGLLSHIPKESDNELLLNIIDITWNIALRDQSVPSSEIASDIIRVAKSMRDSPKDRLSTKELGKKEEEVLPVCDLYVPDSTTAANCKYCGQTRNKHILAN